MNKHRQHQNHRDQLGDMLHFFVAGQVDMDLELVYEIDDIMNDNAIGYLLINQLRNNLISGLRFNDEETYSDQK